jgi:hypothetical protein
VWHHRHVPLRWLIVLGIVLFANRDASAQVFRARGKLAARPTPVTAKAAAAPTVPAPSPVAAAPAAPAPAAAPAKKTPRKVAKKKRRKSNDDVVIEDDEDDVTIKDEE